MTQTTLLIAFTLAVLLSLGQASWIQTVYTSVLTGNQEIPNAGNKPSFGTAVCTYERNTNPKTLDCQVSHNVQSPISASIFLGLPHSAGDALYTFTVPLTPVFREAFALSTVRNNYTFQNQELDFLSGAWYISINSYLFRDGEIRGQLLHNSRFYSLLTYQSINPPPAGTIAQGVMVANYSPYRPQRLLQIEISHSVQDPIEANIFFGLPQLGSSSLLSKFNSPESPIQSSIDLSVVESEFMLNGLTYIQINSVRNSFANAQGVIRTIDVPPTMSYSARLNGQSLTPPTPSRAVGCALFHYNCDTRVFEYFVVHTVQGATGARIEQAIAGEPNRVVINLTRAQSPIYGSFQLTPEQEFRLLNYTFELNILSYSYPSGEILGVINSDWQYYAYLSGTYVNPPRTTASIGCATFSLSSNHTFNYEIVTLVAFPRGIEFSVGEPGENGEVVNLYPGTNRTLSGTVQLNGNGRRALAAERLYIQVRSASFPAGAIRGQVYSLDACEVEGSGDIIPGSAMSIGPAPILFAMLILILCLLC